MSGVFRNTDPPTLSPPGECVLCTPSPLVRGDDTLAGGRRGGGSIVQKTPDTALYSIYVSTLWIGISYFPLFRADSAALLNLLENSLGRSKPATRLRQAQ